MRINFPLKNENLTYFATESEYLTLLKKVKLESILQIPLNLQANHPAIMEKSAGQKRAKINNDKELEDISLRP